MAGDERSPADAAAKESAKIREISSALQREYGNMDAAAKALGDVSYTRADTVTDRNSSQSSLAPDEKTRSDEGAKAARFVAYTNNPEDPAMNNNVLLEKAYERFERERRKPIEDNIKQDDARLKRMDEVEAMASDGKALGGAAVSREEVDKAIKAHPEIEKIAGAIGENAGPRQNAEVFAQAVRLFQDLDALDVPSGAPVTAMPSGNAKVPPGEGVAAGRK